VSTTLDQFTEEGKKDEPTVEYLLHLYSEGTNVRLNNRKIGVLARSPYGKIYITKRGPAELFRKFNSWGITEEVLKTVRNHGAEKVAIIMEDKDTARAWISDITEWFTEAIPWWWKEGHELQKHLPLEKMKELPSR